MVFWDEIAALVAADFPDVTWEKELVDAMAARMVRKPRQHRHRGRDQPARRYPVRPRRGAGRPLGIAPTANIDPERRSPSMFEPIHGSAFDITGKATATTKEVTKAVCEAIRGLNA